MTDQTAQREALAQIGKQLVERGALTAEALARALEHPAASESRFLAGLVESGDATEGALVSFLAERSGFPGIDLSRSAFLLSVLDMVPRPVAEHDQLLPLSTEGGRLHIAVITPNEASDSIDEVRFVTGMDISLYIALPRALEACISSAFDARERGETIWRGRALAPDASPKLAPVHPSPFGPETQAAEARKASSPGARSAAAGSEAASPASAAAPAPSTTSAPAETSAAPAEPLAAEPAPAQPDAAPAIAAPAPAVEQAQSIVELVSSFDSSAGVEIIDAEVIEGEPLEGELVAEEVEAEVVDEVSLTATPIESPKIAPAARSAKPPALEIEVGDDGDEEEEIVVSVRTGPKRILVVDDEPDIIRLCTRALQLKGYIVDPAADGAIAEAKLKKQPYPDLVLLDAMLPLVHGFEICQRIKSSKALRGVPVIMMSAIYRGWRFAQDARETYGADDFIEKPFHLADLLRRVDERLAEGKPEAPKKDSIETLYRKGVDALAAGKAQEGKAALEAAAREDPFSPRIQFALGGALMALGDTYRAISAYERAVELRPKLFPALKSLAALYLEKGFRKKASETLERAFATAPDPKSREEIRNQLAQLI